MTITVLMIGNEGCGKTSFLKRQTTGDFEKEYYPTIGVHTFRLKPYKNLPELCIYDTGDLHRKICYTEAEAAFCMFDFTSLESYHKLVDLVKELRDIKPNIPLIVLGNKCDCKNREVKPLHIRLHRDLGLSYFDVSAKSNYNQDKPFMKLYSLLGYTQSPVINDEENGIETKIRIDNLFNQKEALLKNFEIMIANENKKEILEYLKKHPEELVKIIDDRLSVLRDGF